MRRRPSARRLFYYRKAEAAAHAGAGAGRVRAIKQVEKLRTCLIGNAVAVVCKAQAHHAVRSLRGYEYFHPFAAGIAYAVAYYVFGDAAELIAIGCDDGGFKLGHVDVRIGRDIGNNSLKLGFSVQRFGLNWVFAQLQLGKLKQSGDHVFHFASLFLMVSRYFFCISGVSATPSSRASV